MLAHKTFKYELKPTRTQANLFAQFAGAARFVFNWALAERIEHYKETGKSLSKFDQCNLLTDKKKDPGHLWLKDVYAQSLQRAIGHLDSAFKNFFRRLKTGENPGFPKFKKKGQKDSFSYPQNVKINGSKIWLPKVGWVKFHNSRKTEGKIKTVTVKREADRWFVSVLCEVEIEDRELPPADSQNAIGIDLGIKNFAFLSDGTSVDNPRFLKAGLDKIKGEQRKLSKKRPGSSNHKKQKMKLAKAHRKVANQRKDFQQKLSTQLVKNHDIICVENLNIAQMVTKPGFGQSVNDVGWAGFVSMLEYKCGWIFKRFVKVDRFLATSQICSSCGERKSMPLSVRTYSCGSCGLVVDRDWNASLNIRAAGLAVLACGGSALAEPVKQESLDHENG